MTSPLLLSGLKLRGLEIRNRIGVSPMCQFRAVDGHANDWHFAHLSSFAIGGAGLIFVEATAVEPEGRITKGCLGLWSDDHIPVLKRITTFAHQHGSAIGIQIGHAGRKASSALPWHGGAHLREEEGGWETKAPSAIAYGGENWKIPKEMTLEDIAEVQDKFVAAAQRAVSSGFDFVELHGAHGYLIHSFYSPLSNHRTDRYGGSFENRARFLLETATKVRAAIPETMPLLVRLSAVDYTEGGWTLDDSVRLSKLLKEVGVDAVDVSSGGNVTKEKRSFNPGFQVPFSDEIRREAQIPTAAVGGITSGKQAEGILKEGKADIILVAREFLRDPHFAFHAARELESPDSNNLFPVNYSAFLRY